MLAGVGENEMRNGSTGLERTPGEQVSTEAGLS